MEEAKLNIKENGEWRNLALNEKETLDIEGVGKVTLPILREERFIIVEKLFPEPREIQSTKYTNPDGTPKLSWSYKVKYGEDEVSFFLNKKKEADAFNILGDVGDKIKITAETYDNKFSGKSQNLKFELM